MVIQGCVKTVFDDSKYSSPVPVIGLYIAAASLACFMAMLYDIVSGFRHRKRWLPCQWFSLDSVTLTMLGVAAKIPLDLTTPMPSALDQFSKLSGTTFLCIAMAFLMPSVGKKQTSECVKNMVALTIFVVTVIVNICLQIHTGVIFMFVVEHIITMCCLLGFLIVLWDCVVAATSEKELSIDQNKDLFTKGKGSMLERLQVAYFYAFNYNPQFVICRNVELHQSTGMCIICSVVLIPAAIKSLTWEFCRGSSDYMWSMWIIVMIQILTIILGSVASSIRYFAFSSQVELDASYNYVFAGAKFVILSNPLLRMRTRERGEMVLFFILFLASMIVHFSVLYPLIFVRFLLRKMFRLCLEHKPKDHSEIDVRKDHSQIDEPKDHCKIDVRKDHGEIDEPKDHGEIDQRKNHSEIDEPKDHSKIIDEPKDHSEIDEPKDHSKINEYKYIIDQCYGGDRELQEWVVVKAVEDIKRCKDESRSESSLDHLSCILPKQFHPSSDELHTMKLAKKDRVSSLSMVLLVRIAQVSIPPKISATLVKVYEEAFHIIHFVEDRMLSMSFQNRKESELAKAVWRGEDFSTIPMSFQNRKEYELAKAVWRGEDFSAILPRLGDSSNDGETFSSQSELDHALSIMDLLKNAMPSDTVGDEVRRIIDIIKNGFDHSSVENLNRIIEESFFDMLHELLVQLPHAIYKEVTESFSEDFDTRVRLCLGILCKVQPIEAHIRWSFPVGCDAPCLVIARDTVDDARIPIGTNVLLGRVTVAVPIIGRHTVC